MLHDALKASSHLVRICIAFPKQSLSHPLPAMAGIRMQQCKSDRKVHGTVYYVRPSHSQTNQVRNAGGWGSGGGWGETVKQTRVLANCHCYGSHCQSTKRSSCICGKLDYSRVAATASVSQRRKIRICWIPNFQTNGIWMKYLLQTVTIAKSPLLVTSRIGVLRLFIPSVTKSTTSVLRGMKMEKKFYSRERNHQY